MNRLGGYIGRILYVDLASGVLVEEYPSESLLREFIGGYGLGARAPYDPVHQASRGSCLVVGIWWDARTRTGVPVKLGCDLT